MLTRLFLTSALSRPSRTFTFRHARLLVLSLILPLFLIAGAPSADATSPGVGWAIKSDATPTSFTAGDTPFCEAHSVEGETKCDAYQVTVTNVGSAVAVDSGADPIVVKDRVPAGLKILHVEEQNVQTPSTSGKHSELPACEVSTDRSEARCDVGLDIEPEAAIELRVALVVEPGAPRAVTNHVEVEQNGVMRALSTPPGVSANTVNGPTAEFGVGAFVGEALGPEGLSDVQAGDHPTTNETSLDWTTELNRVSLQDPYVPDQFVQEPRSTVIDLPPGFVGDAQVLGTCSLAAVKGTLLNPGKCARDSVVGYLSTESATNTTSNTLYNVPPEEGYPAEFAFEYVGGVITLLPRLLPSSEGSTKGSASSGGYVLSVSLPYIPKLEVYKLFGAAATLFGDPTTRDGAGSGEAFLTNPDDCSSAPQNVRFETDSWVDPERWVSAEAPLFEASGGQAVTGCNALTFHPTISVVPETTETDTPSGYEVDLKVPQAANLPGTLATPDLKDAVVSLPEGVSVSPGAANGLVACQASGPEGIELGIQDKLGEGYGVQEGEEMGPDGLVHAAAGHCPAASQVGEVEVVSPLLAEPLEGHVFIAAPSCGGASQPLCTPASAENGELFGIYLEVGSAATGIHVKLRGDVSVNPQTGRVTTRFNENPQLPFSELKLKLNGGARSPLANPQTCETATTTADFTPWSTPETPDAASSSSFGVVACNNAFGPSFSAGTVNSAAGAFSPFTLTFSRHDGEQDLGGITVNMPPGLIGKIAGFAQCGEAEVKTAESNTGTCPAASRVGTSTAAAGAGSAPFYQSGPVYLTGPYNGAPFGLAVVVPANAGPYHLGNVVVRAAIHVNPVTAAATVVSNPLPQMIDGVPLRLQSVNVTVGEANNFTFNATGCNVQAIGASISSVQGTNVGVSTPYQPTGCANLPFKPSLSISTSAGSSKADGASLLVKLAAKAGEANVAQTDLQIPLGLPARLQTLNKACLAATFESDPANCPEGSVIGMATVHTPVLNAPLTGPVIVVSHGGAAFPDVEMVLQGEGVEILLDGHTDIKKGITYSNFEAVPDAPFSSFEASLGEGPHSIFTTERPGQTNLCALTKTVTVSKKETRKVHGKNRKVTVSVKKTVSAALVVPVKLVGQNGAVMTQNTTVGVTGCPPTHPKAQSAVKKKAKASRAAKSSGGKS